MNKQECSSRKCNDTPVLLNDDLPFCVKCYLIRLQRKKGNGDNKG